MSKDTGVVIWEARDYMRVVLVPGMTGMSDKIVIECREDDSMGAASWRPVSGDREISYLRTALKELYRKITEQQHELPGPAASQDVTTDLTRAARHALLSASATLAKAAEERPHDSALVRGVKIRSLTLDELTNGSEPLGVEEPELQYGCNDGVLRGLLQAWVAWNGEIGEMGDLLDSAIVPMLFKHGLIRSDGYPSDKGHRLLAGGE